MIDSKKKYKAYLQADKSALNIHGSGFLLFIRELIAPNYIWKFQRRLRKLEYYKNCKKGLINKLYYYWLKSKHRKLALKLSFSIPENVFGPGLSIAHYGTIVVNSKARVGKNCRIHVCVNIGASGGTEKAPVMGDNVYIGPGAKIYGDITLGNNIAIATNSSVNKSILEDNILIAGSPAKKIKTIDVSGIIPNMKSGNYQ
ncbi:serine O-acetyltransferase [Flagellimonas lutimaris]|uniref:serine O-acetyltransferase n=1 Tax=Flagellimonas lutimaris TaxID=475082 RepID=UPI003F5CC951